MRSVAVVVPGRLPLARAGCIAAAAAAAAAAATVLIPGVCAADTWTGAGPNANWQTDANWLDGNKPVPPEALIFGGVVTTSNNDFAAGTQFNGISFAGGAGSFNLTGNAIVLGIPLTGTPATGDIVNNSTNAQTIALPITLSAGRHNFSTATVTAGALNLSGAITRATGSVVVFTRTGGNINLTGSTLANDASGILGGYATFGNTDWATLDGGNNVVAYTGYTDVAPGATLTTGATQNVRIATQGGNVTMAAVGTTDINTLLYSGATTGVTTAQVIDVGSGNILRFGANGGIFRTTNTAAGAITIGSAAGAAGGTITAGGADNTNGEIVLNTGLGSGGSQVINVNSNIADNGTGVVRVIKTGAGSMSINSVGNTYSGGTYILEGRVNPGGAGQALGAFGTGDVYVYSGGSIFGSNVAHNNNFHIGSLGWATETGIGALRGGTYNGTVELIGDAGISGNSAMNGQISGNFNLVVGATTNIASTPSLNSPLNSYTGNTTIVGRTGGTAGATTLTLGASEVIPHGAGKGNLIIGNAGNTASNTTLNLNGQTETVNGLVTAGTATRGFVQNNSANPATLIVGANDATASYTGTIQDGTGVVNITKTGAGVQTLGGTLSHTGATTVNGGRLHLTVPLSSSAVTVNSSGTLSGTSSVANTVTVNNGGALAGGGGATTATLTLNNTLTLGATTGDVTPLNIAPNVNSPTTPAIQANGTLNLNGGAASVPISITSATPLGTYTLFDYNGTLGGAGFASFTLGATPRLVATLEDNTDNTSVDLEVTAVDFPVWSGAISSEWSTATLAAPKNWVLNSNNANTTDYIEGDSAVFNDSAANTTVNLTVADVLPFSATFNNATSTYTLAGTKAIAGGGTLTKTGAGTLIVTNNNTYTGTTTISGGTVQVGNGGTTGTLGSGAITNNAALVFNRSDAVTVANAIGGSGTVTKNGAGTLTLTGANSYGGGTTVNAGTLRLNTATAAGTGAVGVNSGGTLVFNNVTVANPINVNNGATLGAAAGDNTLSGDVTFSGNSTAYTVDPAGLAGTSRNIFLTGAVHGTGNITVINSTNQANPDGGQGLRFRGSTASDYSGTVTYSNNTKGELQTSSPTGSPAGTAKFVMTAGQVALGDTTDAGSTTNGYSELIVRNEGADAVLGNNVEIAGSGSVVLNMLGASGPGSVSTFGNLRIGNGQQLITYRGSGNLNTFAFQSVTLTGGNTIFSPKLAGFGAVATPAAHLALGPISELAAGSSITMNGQNTLTLTGANTHTGGTTVNSGTLVAANADAFNAGSLNVADGALAQAQAGLPKAVTVSTLNTNATGRFDVTSNSMVIKGMTDAQVRTQLQSGYNGGAWNGATGIVSTNAATSTETSVGFASNTSLGLTEFKGVAGLTGSDVIVKYTYAGDANLDGKVDIGDLGLLAGAWQQLTGKVWFDGDFTYDGAVNIGDLGLLAGNWQKGTVGNPNPPLMDFNTALAQFSAFDGVVVPEPTGLALLGVAGVGLLARRRRRTR